jgi:hypothetical protein
MTLFHRIQLPRLDLLITITLWQVVRAVWQQSLGPRQLLIKQSLFLGRMRFSFQQMN